MKNIVIVIIATVAMIVAYSSQHKINPAFSQGQKQVLERELLAPTDKGPVTVEVLARRAKAIGLSKVYYPEAMGRRTLVKSLDEAVKEFSILTVRPIEQLGIANDYDIVTVFKIKIINTVSKRKAPTCCAPSPIENLPKPTQSDESYLVVSGGSVVIDGVEVVQTGELMNLAMEQEYVVFAYSYELAKAAIIPLGAQGAFQLMLGEALTPHRTGSSVQVEGKGIVESTLEKKFNSSASQFFESIKRDNR